MTNKESLERRLDWMETRAELTELVTRYGKAVDERDIVGLADLFTEDGRMYSRDRALEATGRQGIACRWLQAPGLGSTSAHLL